jgi:uncharacterized OB-fold protein
MGAKIIADGLIVGEGPAARLLGGRRRSDGKFAFPLPKGPEADLFEPVTLAQAGALWSYTVQRFRPKPPYNGPGDDHSFRPYAVGYIELPGQIIVESRIEIDDFADLKIGMPMTLTLQTFRTDESGADVLTYAFRPA